MKIRSCGPPGGEGPLVLRRDGAPAPPRSRREERGGGGVKVRPQSRREERGGGGVKVRPQSRREERGGGEP